MTESHLYFYDYYLFVERWALVIISATIFAYIILAIIVAYYRWRDKKKHPWRY